MASQASRTVPSSPNPSTQGSRDWGNLKTGEPGSAFRGMGRGRASRGSAVRGGRTGSHPQSHSTRGGSDTIPSTPSPSSKVPSVSRKHLPPTSTAPISNGASENAVNGASDRSGRPKPGSRKQPRAVPAVVVAPPSPSQTSQTAPPTPSRSAHRRRRPQPGKGPNATSKPLSLPNPTPSPKSRTGSTPATQTVMRKDVPPHLVTAHEAEIRHDIDALVERVRAVAMAENRPTTPGSHIDWAGDEDDSLPDLDDWGVTTTHTIASREEDRSEEISPILVDALRPLPEPNSEIHPEEEREMETFDTQSERVEESPIHPSFLPSPTQGAGVVPSSTEEAPEQCILAPTSVEGSSSPTLSNGKHPLHPSLPPKPVAAMESLRARARSTSKPSSLPSKPPVCVTEEESLTAKTEGLLESIHAPSVDERPTLERVSSTSSSERGLTVSIHALVPGLPESHSAPSLLPSHTTAAVPRTHGRSQTEGRTGIHQPHAGPPGTVSHLRGRSGASSPLGKHVFTHARNHSTPAGGTGSRLLQGSRPVITDEAISRLARTIGGHGPTSRAQTIPVTKNSTISS